MSGTDRRRRHRPIVRSSPDRAWWNEVARDAPGATFFHTPIWADIAAVSFGSIDRTIGFEWPDGTRALVPLAETGRHRHRPVLQSSAEGCYGDLISTRPLSSARRRLVTARLAMLGYHTVQILENPLEVGSGVGPTLRGATSRSESTWVIPLDDGFDAAFAGFQARLRTHYRKGLRSGVEVEVSTSIDDYRSHYEAYRDAVDRWGESDAYGYDWATFEALHGVAAEHPEHIRLWIARVDGAAVGGRLVFYWNRRAVLWHGSARREYLDHHVVPVLDVEIARHAADIGASAYDLNTTGDHPGVIRYKQRFRPVEVPLRITTHHSLPFRVRRAARG